MHGLLFAMTLEEVNVFLLKLRPCIHHHVLGLLNAINLFDCLKHNVELLF